MRCLALAQAWQDAGGQAMFAMAESTPALVDRISREWIEFVSIPAPAGSEHDAAFVENLARLHGANWIAIDGYKFDDAYQESVRRSGAKTLVIDDFGGGSSYSADLILNQNLCASICLYKNREAKTRVLLGTRFALLRREFTSWSSWRREVPPRAHSVLVTMGGSDPTGLTERIADRLSVSDVRTTFLVGGSARKATEFLNMRNASLLVDRNDMAKIMAETDIVVLCCGGTLWESLFMGCATLAYTRDDHQAEIMQRLEEVGAARWLGAESLLECEVLAKAITEIVASHETRERICALGRTIVDGMGARRVVAELKKLN